MNKIFIFIAIILLGSSCVTSKKYKAMTANFQESEKTVQSLKEQNQVLKIHISELERQIEKQQTEYAVLQSQLSSLKSGSSSEIARLMEKLQQAQIDMQKREESLNAAQTELEQRTKRLAELEIALQQKDEAVKQLRQKVMDALLGFNNKGLTIQEKNGKVYVSLEEQLLFKTGQWDVDPKGQIALINLAEVLGENPDINVLVEGHTDDVPMRGVGTVKDNWDLSVLRATAVTRILLTNKAIEPKRITSAGRGEFFPIDEAKTPEARQKNRRTEIILTPRLDEIFRILESN
jgi:chemotaxis protein MotB